MAESTYDVAIVGCGIVGMATALALAETTRARVIALDAERDVARHQTGHNSGVIHSGLYYKPGSLKAQNCVEGRELLYRFCQEHGVRYERCGKVVVAVDAAELPALAELERRGHANGLRGLRRITPEELREREPHVQCVAALLVPETGIVDYVGATRAYAARFQELGGTLSLAHRLRRVARAGDGLTLETTAGAIHTRQLINCGGLEADRVARACGVDPGVQIVPFRGEYYELAPQRQSLVRHLIYPVPDPRFPFLGVHFTRMVAGGVEAGPNAVLALKREGYHRLSFSPRDVAEMARFGGLWRFARQHWRTGIGEYYRSFSKGAFVAALRRLIPELRAEDVHPAGAGVRAQALGADGKLIDDFHIVPAERMIHVLNAPSPAATASISIGRKIAQMASQQFALPARDAG